MQPSENVLISYCVRISYIATLKMICSLSGTGLFKNTHVSDVCETQKFCASRVQCAVCPKEEKASHKPCDSYIHARTRRKFPSCDKYHPAHVLDPARRACLGRSAVGRSQSFKCLSLSLSIYLSTRSIFYLSIVPGTSRLCFSHHLRQCVSAITWYHKFIYHEHLTVVCIMV